jgi:hypothetical protein
MLKVNDNDNDADSVTVGLIFPRLEVDVAVVDSDVGLLFFTLFYLSKFRLHLLAKLLHPSFSRC